MLQNFVTVCCVCTYVYFMGVGGLMLLVIQLFDAMITEFPEVEVLEKDFENYSLLWHTAGDFLKVLPQWTDGAFNLLVAEDVLNNAEVWFKASAKCAKLLTGPAKMVAEQLKQQLEAFQVRMYLGAYINTNPQLTIFHHSQKETDVVANF